MSGIRRISSQTFRLRHVSRPVSLSMAFVWHPPKTLKPFLSRNMSMAVEVQDDTEMFRPVDIGKLKLSSWWTGKVPLHGKCPGVSTSGQIHSLPQLNLHKCSKEALHDYFDNTWAITEVLLSSLKNTDAFTIPPPHKLRHPMIFYYGHPAVLYVNKLRVAGLLHKPINPYFETVFEVGVDEMKWDDLSKNALDWPSIAEVTEYRREVYNTVSKLISNLSDEECKNITQKSPLWALVMAFEHERIHIETSSVLIAEMGIQHVRFPAGMPSYHPSVHTSNQQIFEPKAGVHYPTNDMISVDALTVTLGKRRDYPSFGWDNEFGSRSFDVSSFRASMYKITNGEYLDFVKAGGYARQELWSEAGWAWKTYGNVKWPTFWRPTGPQGLHQYHLRLLFDEVAMQWDWPVVANYHEATAFACWKSEQSDKGKEAGKQSVSYRLITELEHHAIRDPLPVHVHASTGSTLPEDPIVFAKKGALAEEFGVNANLSYSSMSPVTSFPPNNRGFHDVHGNAWEWCADHFSALPGFQVHPLYEDFSSPCFDGHHNVIMGSSFMSTGNEASHFSRFHFRPHFHQHASFRLVEVPPGGASLLTSDTDAPGPYAGADYPFRRSALGMAGELLSSQRSKREAVLQREFVPASFSVTLPTVLHSLVHRHAGTVGVDLSTSRVLEVGCGVGGLAVQLGPDVRSFWGIDRNDEDLNTARALARGESVSIRLCGEGDVAETVAVSVPDEANKHNYEFRCADPTCLPAEMCGFDVVVINDVLADMVSPNALLGRLAGSRGLVRKGGLLVVASTFLWREDQTPRSLWLGGFADEDTGTGTSGKGVESVDGLIHRLSEDFNVVEKSATQTMWRTSLRDVRGRLYDVVVFRRK